MGVFERQRQPCICFSWSCAALHHHSDHDPRMYTWIFITQCWQNEQEEHVPFNQLKILSRGPGDPFDWSLLHTATSPSMLSLKAKNMLFEQVSSVNLAVGCSQLKLGSTQWSPFVFAVYYSSTLVWAAVAQAAVGCLISKWPLARHWHCQSVIFRKHLKS